jgi:hypothetical protein
MRRAKEWTLDHELLAQLVEEVSVVAAKDYWRRKPREVPRPKHLSQSSRYDDGNPRSVRPAINVLKGSRRAVYQR